MTKGMKKLILISTFILVTGIESIGAQEKIDLSGKWSFGVAQRPPTTIS